MVNLADAYSVLMKHFWSSGSHVNEEVIAAFHYEQISLVKCFSKRGTAP